MTTTLAERLTRHLQTPARPADHDPDGVMGFLGATVDARTLVARWLGRDFDIVAGVRLALPPGLNWHTSDRQDGGVQIAFANPCPIVVAEWGPLAGRGELQGVIVQISAEQISIQAMLRRFLDFTYTIQLR